MEEFKSIMQIIEHARSFGHQSIVSNGAQLFGHVPHIAPEAWFHQVFKPLNEKAVDALELEVGIKLPAQFRNFLMLTNGIKIFSGSLTIYGKRYSYARTGDDIRQPYCIVDPNTLERLHKMQPQHLIIGGYFDDADSQLIMDTKENFVFRRTRKSPKVLNKWPDFWTMLKSETIRLKSLFDETGHKIGDVPITPPPD